MQNGNIQLLFIRIEQSVQIQALSASSTMNKSIIGFLNLLVMKTEIRQIGPYFHPTMIICKVFLLITKPVQNHTKLEHTTRLKGRDNPLVFFAPASGDSGGHPRSLTAATPFPQPPSSHRRLSWPPEAYAAGEDGNGGAALRLPFA